MSDFAVKQTYTAAVIGVGRGGKGSAGAHSIGYAHGNTYRCHPRVDLVAAMDINAENLQAFLGQFELSQDCGFDDTITMVEAAKPDMVSLCTYAPTHRPIIEQLVDSGVKAIFCEKPFVVCMDDARAIKELCEQNNVKLIVNHYRRELDLFRTAARLVREGAIGRPVLFLAGIDGWDQMEWGTHWLDAFRAFAGDQPIRTVSATVECSGDRVGYGHVMEEYSISTLTFEDGTRAILEGGRKPPGDFAVRLIGESGFIDLLQGEELKLVNADGEQAIRCASTLHGPSDPNDETGHPITGFSKLIDQLISWNEGGEEPSTGITNAIKSTELYLAAYEAALQSRVITIPLGPQSRFPLDGFTGSRDA